MLAIKLTNRINIGDELIASCEGSSDFELQVLLGATDNHPLLAHELLEQMNSLMQEPIPGLPLPVLKRSVAEGFPFFEQRFGAVPLFEVSAECLLKAAAKDHGCPGVLLAPAIEIAVAIAARAAQVLADLGIAVSHARVSLASLWESSSHSAAG